MNENKETLNKKEKRASLYQIIWRWHFYAGIIFAPFLFILAFSGAVYLFKPQIESYLYKEMVYVDNVQETKLTYAQQLERVYESFPGASVASFTINDDVNKTTEFSIREDGMALSVFVNPYTGEIQGQLENDKKLAQIFKKLHSELLIGGTIGNRIVELVACWAIILLVTGLYIWWPRNGKAIWGTILPRLRRKDRVFWRDVHAVPAFWLSLFILILIATGLPWSGVLGPQIQNLAVPPQYAYSFGEKPESITLTKDIAEDVPWANENLVVPVSTVNNYIPLTIDEVEAIIGHANITLPYTISMPVDEYGVFTASHMKHPSNLATLHLDQYSGAILSDVRFSDFSFGAKLIENGIALHEGRLFGWPNQVLGLITCLGLMLIVASSFMMWQKRKPKGGFGGPAKPNDRKMSIIVFLILLGFGILMPLVGISLILIFIVDQIIRPLFLKVKNAT